MPKYIDLCVARQLDNSTIKVSLVAGACQETFMVTPAVAASVIRELAVALASRPVFATADRRGSSSDG